MKKSTLLPFFLIFVLLCTACKTNTEKNQDSTQMEEVMKIHDEVMPKMGTLSKLVAELKEKVDTTAVGQQYGTAMKDLQDANKAMMDWMRGFGDRFDSDEILNGKALSAQKQKWLNEEEEKVQALKEQINTSIEKAEALLNKG
ncbi:Hypothetical protein I595_1295 [Croceitalea dokdonensis DOKDO 023]|uniref:Viral A-type inclusion protein n=1 Tax=Croceitalea dokdonensis DOKDO 023 TaxID=1300341 RepID=A0A0N8H4B0_9FLAO|nr:hypothetical protein [Croceitalea dokdonensis]KPM32868.1 Hypothetical protein I595_1295 [Croceitalea dokdonensis DOKDO 023]